MDLVLVRSDHTTPNHVLVYRDGILAHNSFDNDTAKYKPAHNVLTQLGIDFTEQLISSSDMKLLMDNPPKQLGDVSQLIQSRQMAVVKTELDEMQQRLGELSKKMTTPPPLPAAVDGDIRKAA